MEKKVEKIVEILTLALLFAQFIIFLEKTYYFNYFNIDISLYTFNAFIDLSKLALTTILLVVFILTSYICEHIYESVEKTQRSWLQKLPARLILLLLFIIISSFFNFLLFAIDLITAKAGFVPSLILILIFDFYNILIFIALHCIRKDIKASKIKQTDSIHFISSIITIIVIIIFIIIGGTLSGYTSAKRQKVFNLINQNEVIIHNTNNYAIVESAEIKDNEIIIDTSKSKKISLDEIEIERRAFDKVTIKR